MDLPCPIIDPHIHQWDLLRTPRMLSRPRRWLGWWPWLYRTTLEYGASATDRAFVGRTDHVAWDYLPVDYSADASGLPIREVVHVEAGWCDQSPLGPVAETKWLDSLFAGSSGPELGGIVAYADLASPHVTEVLKAHCQASSKLRGIRQMLAFDDDRGVRRFCKTPQLAASADWRRGFERLQPLRLCFDAWVFHHQLREIQNLAEAFPEQLIVLDHLGTPVGWGGPFASYGHSAADRERIRKTWQEGIANLATCDNVAVKLSGFFMPAVGWGYEKRDQSPSGQELLDAFSPAANFVLKHFGLNRCMFASNFPMDKASLSLQSLYRLYAATVAGLAIEDQRKLFLENAKRVYRLAWM